MPGKKLCLFLLPASFFIYAITAEDADIKTITSSLEKFRKNYPQEKVHLHLDKLIILLVIPFIFPVIL